MRKSIGYVVAGLLLAFLAAGCSSCPMHKMLGLGGDQSQKTVKGPDGAAIQQQTCPVLAGKINPQIHTDYEGRRVYFCCPSCIEAFQKDPQKYVAKLGPKNE